MKKITAKRELLVVVDMLNGFAIEGPLASEKVRELIEPMKAFLSTYEGDIVFASDAHEEGAVEFEIFPPHCIKGTREAEIVEVLKPFAEKNFEKNSINAFHVPELREYLMNTHVNYDQILIIGCCTDICIINLALSLKSFFNQLNLVKKIGVIKSLVATYDAPDHNSVEASRSAFRIMETCGIQLHP